MFSIRFSFYFSVINTNDNDKLVENEKKQSFKEDLENWKQVLMNTLKNIEKVSF